jgi:hypothetical protein
VKLFSIAKSLISNQVRSGKDGFILTCSGRTIPMPPYADFQNDCELTPYDQWLVCQAQQEAEVTRDEVMLSRLISIDPCALTEELRGLLHDYLFGEMAPCFGIDDLIAIERRNE